MVKNKFHFPGMPFQFLNFNKVLNLPSDSGQCVLWQPEGPQGSKRIQKPFIGTFPMDKWWRKTRKIQVKDISGYFMSVDLTQQGSTC